MIETLSGSVWMDGVLAYTGVTPKFGEFGLDVMRLFLSQEGVVLIGVEGPHFSFSLPVYFMTNIPEEALATGAVYRFSGPSLGGVTMLYGRPAADSGGRARYITDCSFLIRIEQRAVHIAIDGTAGPIIPETLWIPAPEEPQTRSFKIEFVLPEASFDRVLTHRKTAEAFAMKFKRAVGIAGSARGSR